MKKPLKAFILAAGFGTRLRPLTDNCPKALLPFFGVPLLYLLLEKLVSLKVQEIFVNAHYLSDQIRKAIENYPLSTKVHLSLEEPQILGGSGAIAFVKKDIGDCDLLVINGDILTDFDLAGLVNEHQTRSAIATMGLLQTPYPTKTRLWCNEDRILAIGGTEPKDKLREHTFTGIQILSKDFLNEIPNEGPSEIIPIYQRLIEKGTSISYFASDALWFDIGTPESYFGAQQTILDSIDQKEILDSLQLPIAWKKLGLKNVIQTV